jgi:hypothetical protein
VEATATGCAVVSLAALFVGAGALGWAGFAAGALFIVLAFLMGAFACVFSSALPANANVPVRIKTTAVSCSVLRNIKNFLSKSSLKC